MRPIREIMTGVLRSGALALILWATVAAVELGARSRLSGRRPLLTVSVALILIAMFAVQCSFPSALTALARQPVLIEYGQVWRLLTALFVQDGGVEGLIFNA